MPIPACSPRSPTGVAGLEVVHLDRNHRCTPQVVAAAAAALGPADVAPPTSATADGPVPTLTAFDDDRAEAEAVAARILARAEAGTRLVRPGRAGPHPRPAGRGASGPRRGPASRAGSPRPPTPTAEPRPRGRPAGRAAGPARSRSGRGDPGGGVELATFHRAKGLEWEAVSVVGLEEGFVPIVHAATPEAVAEERRLLYVALTRAGRILECSWARAADHGRRAGDGRAGRRRGWPDLADACTGGVERPAGPRTPADRFAALRANLRG